MGNYRQHITFATVLGGVYSIAAAVLAGLHWAYATVALLLSALGGLLPDLDSPSGVGLKGFTGILGVLGALMVWRQIGTLDQPPGFEYNLWAMVGAYILIRHGLRRFMVHVSVHRGMNHSIPTGALWGAVTYLAYPSDHHTIRVAMAVAVMVGFLSHLILDEICSVDLEGARLNKAFGTALKFWSPSTFSTIAVYLCLSLLCWKVTKVWPDDSVVPTNLASPGPDWPYAWPQSWAKDNFKEVREFANDQFHLLPQRVEQVKKVAGKEFEGLPEDLGRLKSYAEKQLPGGVEQAQEKLSKLKDFTQKQLPGGVEGVQEKVSKVKEFTQKQFPGGLEDAQGKLSKAKELTQKRLPDAVDQIKKASNEFLPSRQRR